MLLKYFLTCLKKGLHSPVAKGLDIMAPFQMGSLRMIGCRIPAHSDICPAALRVIIEHSRLQIGVDTCPGAQGCYLFDIDKVSFPGISENLRHLKSIADQGQRQLVGIGIASLSHGKCQIGITFFKSFYGSCRLIIISLIFK